LLHGGERAGARSPETDAPARSAHRAAAFFDIDGTLLSVNTAPLYARYLREHGRARRRDLLRTAYYLALYRLNLLDIDRAISRASGFIAGQVESEVAAFCEQWYRDVVRAYLVPGMLEIVERHRAAGHELALLSSSTGYLATPLARELHVDHLLVTRLEVVDGRFTGRAVAPVCYGAGKVHWARQFAAQNGIDLARSFFYTDSVTDVPVLELVGHPRVVNPDRLLRRYARKRGWEVVAMVGGDERGAHDGASA
jgi:HAD superfamily hydrolase (TIGR01490 family)